MTVFVTRKKQKTQHLSKSKKKTVPFSLPMRFVSFLSLFLVQTLTNTTSMWRSFGCQHTFAIKIHWNTKPNIYNEIATKTNWTNPLPKLNNQYKCNRLLFTIAPLYSHAHEQISKINSPHPHCYRKTKPKQTNKWKQIIFRGPDGTGDHVEKNEGQNEATKHWTDDAGDGPIGDTDDTGHSPGAGGSRLE